MPVTRSKPARPKASARSATACCEPGRPRRPRATASYAALFKALGDATRLEIVGLLAAAGAGKELCVCDLESHFELRQPTISHHLRLLREAGLVTAERRGTWVWYCLTPQLRERLAAFADLLAN